MKLPRRQFLHLAAGAAALLPVSGTARAQAYPTRPVHWIVGFPPGGGADTVVRIVASWLSERVGQQVIVENRPGAGTNIAVQAVVNSPADGYTLLMFGLVMPNMSMFHPSVRLGGHRAAPDCCHPVVLSRIHRSPPRRLPSRSATPKNPGKVSIASFGTGTAPTWRASC
jgi:hypothetical protein